MLTHIDLAVHFKRIVDLGAFLRGSKPFTKSINFHASYSKSAITLRFRAMAFFLAVRKQSKLFDHVPTSYFSQFYKCSKNVRTVLRREEEAQIINHADLAKIVPKFFVFRNTAMLGMHALCFYHLYLNTCIHF